MHSKIPLPTDNIYKFYALFGLMLLISSMALFVINYSTYQQRSFDRFLELSVLIKLKELTPQQLTLKEMYQAQAVVDKSDKKTYLYCISVFITLSLFLMFYGFLKWHRNIQPLQDLLIKKQIEKIELEIKQLNSSSKKKYIIPKFK